MARFLLLLALFVVIARTFWRFFDAVVRGASGPAPQGGRAAIGAAGGGEDVAMPGVRDVRGAGEGDQRRQRRLADLFRQREMPR